MGRREGGWQQSVRWQARYAAEPETLLVGRVASYAIYDHTTHVVLWCAPVCSDVLSGGGS
jgi:hypothetical protein